MKKLILFLLLVGCNTMDKEKVLKNELQFLKKENDSLRNELQKCDMMLESYEGLPMGI